MNISKKTINLIILFLIINALLGTLSWFISDKTVENTEKIVGLNNELNQQLVKEQELKTFKEIIDDTSLDREKINSYFVSTDGSVALITEIERLADISDVSIKINSVLFTEYIGDNGKSENLEFLNLNLNTSSKWNNTFYFLSFLENMPYKIFIDSLNFTAKKNVDGATLNWDGAMSLRILKL